MQRVQLSHAEREWLVAHANVVDPLRLELIALALSPAEEVALDIGRQGITELDVVFLAAGDVYHAKMSDGLTVATLAVKVWAALLREREDEIAPIFREGFDARDQDGDAIADGAGDSAGVQPGSGARAEDYLPTAAT
jgi:hypothetical protein